MRGGRSAAVDCKLTGWGFRVGHWYAAGAWPMPFRRALKERRVSITPLEYVVALFAVSIWLKRWEDIGTQHREEMELVVGMCDNEAA